MINRKKFGEPRNLGCNIAVVGNERLNMEWRKINIENAISEYSISEYGDLRNDTTNKIRKRTYTKNYCRYFITLKDKKFTNKFAHRLVAECFIEVDNEEMRKLAINHIDGNKLNNHYTNLEYVTNKENTLHAIRNGLFSPQDQSSKSVNAYDIYGNFIETFISESEASRKLGINVGDVSEICNRKNGAKQAKKYQFRFVEDCDDVEDISMLTSGMPQKIIQYDLNGHYIAEFNSIAEANRKLGKDNGSGFIGRCCKNKCKSAYGYKWEFANK